MKILLMGGSVFVGRAVLRGLLASGATVRAVTRGTAAGDWSRAEHVAVDRRDPERLRAALRGYYPDAVVDVSAYTAADCSHLLRALERPPRSYLLVSSAAVYTRTAGRLPFMEDAPATGDDIWGEYGVDKAAAEQVLLRSNVVEKFVFRPPYLYGPGNNLDRESFIWTRALGGKTIFIPGDGETLIQMCHVEDLVAAVCDGALNSALPAGTYNVGNPSYLTFNEWVSAVAAVAGVKTPAVSYVYDRSIKPRDYFPFRMRHLLLDTRKLGGTSRLVPRSFELGIAETYASWRPTAELQPSLSAVEFELARGRA
jgi:2'-hydroxyisoflavone reductase